MQNPDRPQRSEMIDSLLLEASSLPPSEHETVVSTYPQEIISAIKTLYNQYIPVSHFAAGQQAAQGIITTDSVSNFVRAWNDLEYYPESEATTMQRDRLILLTDPAVWWARLSEEEQEQYGQADMIAEVAFADMIRRTVLAEELLHQFQDWNLPYLVQECGVKFYKRRVLEEMSLPHLRIPAENQADIFWGRLLEDFGAERVHKFFFGSLDYTDPVNMALRREITARVEERRDILLPDYSALYPESGQEE